jgi:PAS domain S-box-containing protein
MNNNTLVKNDSDEAILFTMAYKIALLVGILVLLTTFSISAWIFSRSNEELINRKMSELSVETNLQSIRFKAQIEELVKDTLFLSGTPPIDGILRTQYKTIDSIDGSSTAKNWKQRLESIFTHMMNTKPYYLQIRYIGVKDGGRELVRVDRMGPNGSLRVVAEADMQQKGDRPYFTKALRVGEGKVTLSDINLNREFGEITIPHTPVLRASTPIFDDQGNLFGVVVINKDITLDMNLLANIYDIGSTLYITNSRGDYLYHPDGEKTYRFEYDESELFQNDYPEFSQAFKKNIELDEVKIHENEQGTFDVISLRKINYDPYDSSQIIGIVIKEEGENILAVSSQIRQQASIIFIIFILVVLSIGFIFAKKLSRPIIDITKAAKEFSSGNMHVEFPVHEKGEAGLLARAFADLITNVKEREETLKVEVEERDKAQQQIKAVLDNAVDAIITIDMSGSILTANNAAVKTFGYERAEMLGQNVKMLMPEPYRKEHDGYLDNYFRTGTKHVIGIGREVIGLRKDGSTFPMELSVSEVVSEGYISFTGIVRDISEEKRVETEIKEALRFNQLIMTNIPDMIFVKDSAFRIVQANQSFLNVYPESMRENVIGSTTIENYDEKEAQEFLKDDRRALEEGYIEAEENIKFPDGITRTLLTKKVRFENSKGEKFILGVGHDITLRKQAEKSLIRFNKNIEDQKNYYESLIRNLNVPAFILNPQHEVIIWNKACEQLTGVLAEEVLGTSDHWIGFYNENRPLLADIIIDSSYDLIENLYETELENSFIEGGRQIENWCPLPRTKKERYLAIDAGPIFDNNGQLIAVIEVLKDITSIKQTQDILKAQREELERSNSELERFAYIASHDLQEPLRMVSSYTQLLAKRYKDKLDQDANDYIDFAVDGAVRMQALIQDLLKYSRLSSNTVELEEINTNEMFDYAIRNLEVAIDETGTVVTKDDLPTLSGDQGQLRQLFQNIIGNAIKYRDPEKLSKVHVSAKAVKNGWQFCIEDNGIGISPEYYEKIFVIFKRLHGNSEYKGTGIGLALCKRIVESHHGQIWVESEPGKGSKFFFSLCNAEAETATEEAA